MTEPTKAEILAGAWHANKRPGDPDCEHRFTLGPTMDMYPPIYTRHCVKCDRWESSQGPYVPPDATWRV